MNLLPFPLPTPANWGCSAGKILYLNLYWVIPSSHAPSRCILCGYNRDFTNFYCTLCALTSLFYQAARLQQTGCKLLQCYTYAVFLVNKLQLNLQLLIYERQYQKTCECCSVNKPSLILPPILFVLHIWCQSYKTRFYFPLPLFATMIHKTSPEKGWRKREAEL